MIEQCVEMGEEAVNNIKKVLIEYAKQKEISSSGRKYFYTALEEIDVRLFQIFDRSIDTPDIDVEIIDDATETNNHSNGNVKKYNDQTSKEIFDYLLEEDTVTQPLEDDNFIRNENFQHVFMAEDDPDDDYIDPYANLSYNEMVKKLPPYFNKTAKQKKKLFKNINSKYWSSLKTTIRIDTKEDLNRITFDTSKNSIRKFKKNHKVAIDDIN